VIIFRHARQKSGKVAKLGFFKNFALDVRAQALAATFTELRRDQFSCILTNLERTLHENVTPSMRNLGGEADLALKGFQMRILITFVRTQEYVLAKDLDIFTGLVMGHTCKITECETVGNYCRMFGKSREPCSQVVQVSIPIADYLLDNRKDPQAWTVIGITLMVFLLEVQCVIASEFGDKGTTRLLKSQIEDACRSFD
jgi:hypothetical protein